MAFNINSINQNSQYNTPQVDINIEWSGVKKNATHTSTGNVGYWLPMKPIFCIPGEKRKFKPSVGIQFTPWTNNVFTEFTGEILSYFVPTRLLEDNWEEFITGGEDGQTTITMPTMPFQDILTQANIWFREIGWYPPGSTVDNHTIIDGALHKKINCIWDSMGLPLSALNLRNKNYTLANIESMWESIGATQQKIVNDNMPLAYPFKAYNLIYNKVLRYPDYEEERSLTNLTAFKGHWSNDYFTRARYYQQRGVVPLLPVVPNTLRQTLTHEFVGNEKAELPNSAYAQAIYLRGGQGINKGRMIAKLESAATQSNEIAIGLQPHQVELTVDNIAINLNELMIDLGIMRYMVNNARMQPRYIDQLKARFGVYPEDFRLQLPEYIGHTKISINQQGIVSTADSGNIKQGNITSQAWGNTTDNWLEYESKEHGIIINIFCVKPSTQYDGIIPKQWFHKTRFDYPTPELANTPDVQIQRKELFWMPEFSQGETESNNVGMGWTDIYSEYRTELNTVGGLLAPSNKTQNSPTIDSYTLARFWQINKEPSMNKDFLQINADMDRIKQYVDEPDFIYFYRCEENVAQPLPIRSEPVQIANL